jgi:hypothetical protein
VTGAMRPAGARLQRASAASAESDQRQTETLRLVEADEKATIDLITRLMGTQTATRAAVVPIASGLAGLSLTNHSAGLALVAIPIVIVAIGIEARTGYLQRQAHDRSTYLERIVQDHLTALAEHGGPMQQEANQDFRQQLDGYQYGTSRSLRLVGPHELLGSGLRQASSWLYLCLIALLIIAAIFAAATAPKPTGTCLKTGSGAVVRVEGSGVKLSGDLTVVACPAT